METDILQIMLTAGVEWDLECREAYERGAFDVSRDGWIASAVAQYMAKHIKEYTITKVDLDNVLVELDEFIRNEDAYEYSLPQYDSAQEEMRRILNRGLGLGVNLD